MQTTGSRLVAVTGVMAAWVMMAAQCGAATIAEWKFAAGGNFLIDSSGNGNTLTNDGTVISSADKPDVTGVDGSACFNGSQTSFQTLANLDLSSHSGVTIEWYMKTIAPGNPAQELNVFNHGASEEPLDGCMLVVTRTGPGWTAIRITGGGYAFDTIDSLDATAWHHYAITYDSTSADATAMKMYVDGVLGVIRIEGNVAGSPVPFKNTPFLIGMAGAGRTNFTGYLANVRISDGLLTPGQFLPPPTPPPPPPPPPTSPAIAYWKFEEGFITTDSSTGGTHNLSNSGVTTSPDVPPGHTGTSAYFNGAQTVFQTAAALDLSSYSAITIEWFMKTAQADVGIVWEHGKPFWMFKGAMAGIINQPAVGDWSIWQTSEGSVNYFVKKAPLDSNWHHYAVVIDRAYADTLRRITLYTDGNKVGTVDDNGTSPVADQAFLNTILSIGLRQDGGAPFVGYLDELRISEGILTPEQFLYRPAVKGTVFSIR